MTFSVVGGVYRELCLEPNWDEWFGSGLRAAAAVVELLGTSGEKPQLHTWLSPEEERDVAFKAETLGVSLHRKPRADSIQFQYDHGLATPRIFPDPWSLKPITPDEISIDDGVVFSLIESDAHSAGASIRVKGGTIVYDPQAESKAIPWSRTGNKCRRLAIVANMAEAEAMVKSLGLSVQGGGHPRPAAIGKALADSEHAEVVVVKNGAEGAFVVTSDDQSHVAAYKTDRVFPFGTGDIFTGVFGACWAFLGIDPVLAAERASIAAAIHSNGPILPIPANLDEAAKSLVPHTIRSGAAGHGRSMVYIAGPLFNFPQRWFLGEIRRRLTEQGVRTFSPYHDVGVTKTTADIVRLDLEGLDQSKVVFAVLDGVDAGTLFEIGYAVAKKIPVIGFKQCTADKDLTMLLGSPGCQVYNDFPTAIYHAAWKALES